MFTAICWSLVMSLMHCFPHIRLKHHSLQCICILTELTGELCNFQIHTPAQSCEIGQCATNITTGIKRCPPAGETITLNLGNEVCNGQFTCNNPATPYALQSDGSTNFQGNCEQGVSCPCLNHQSCPSYISSVFSVSTGNPYNPVVGQQISFIQTASNSLASTSGLSLP